MNKICLLVLISICLVSCASRAKKNLQSSYFDTTPTGATIYSIEGKKIGQTPLEKSAFMDLCKRNHTVMIELSGHMPTNYSFNCDEDPAILPLTTLNKDKFKQQTFGQYYKEINEFSSTLLKLHYQVLNNDLENAKIGLQEFRANYPNLVVTYLMLANIELSEGNLEASKGYLSAALRINPEDTTALELYAVIDKENPDKKIEKDLINTKSIRNPTSQVEGNIKK